MAELGVARNYLEEQCSYQSTDDNTDRIVVRLVNRTGLPFDSIRNILSEVDKFFSLSAAWILWNYRFTRSPTYRNQLQPEPESLRLREQAFCDFCFTCNCQAHGTVRLLLSRSWL